MMNADLRFGKEYLDENLEQNEGAKTRLTFAVWWLLNKQEDGWDIITTYAEEKQILNGKVNSQAPKYKAFRTIVQQASIMKLDEATGTLVKDPDAQKLTIGRAKDPVTGKLVAANEIRESGTSRGGNAGGKGKAEPEEKEVRLLATLELLITKFGYENVRNVMEGLKPEEPEIKQAA